MLTVALIGPDGAGKSTLARSLADRLPDPAVTLYMGVNPGESEVRAPVVRLLERMRGSDAPRHDAGPPPRPGERSATPGPVLRRIRRSVRSAARAGLLVLDEQHRQRVIGRHRRAGRIVVLDRDFYADYRAHDIDAGVGRDLGRRLHGAFLERRYQKPDLYVYLHAPAETLFARKGEGTVELLEGRQRDYERLAEHVDWFERLDVDRPVEAVLVDLVDLVTSAARGTLA